MSEGSFKKICTYPFIVTFVVWEGVGDRTELQYIDPPTLMAVSVVSFLVLQDCSTGGPGAQLSAECWLSLPLLVTNGSPKPTGGPEVAFPTTSCLQLQLRLLVLTELYNSSMPTQSPTQSLEWHVWSSSSGNNCHAVHRSLSSDASVYESTMGFFALSHFISQIPPTQFFSFTDHWDVSLPSVASLWNSIFARVEGQNTTLWHITHCRLFNAKSFLYIYIYIFANTFCR